MVNFTYYRDDQQSHDQQQQQQSPQRTTTTTSGSNSHAYFFEITELGESAVTTSLTTTPHAPNYSTLPPRTLHIDAEVRVSVIFHFDRNVLTTCSYEQGGIRLGPYCTDALTTLQVAMKETHWDERIPVLLQFGDEDDSRAYRARTFALEDYVRLPHIKKFRRVVTPAEVERVTSPPCNPGHWQHRLNPIIWKLNSQRHFELLYRVPRYDQAWEAKINRAIFRGALTGTSNDHVINASLTDLENCYNLPRCRLTLNHANSTLVDAKLTSVMGLLPETINQVNLLGETCSMRHIMKYKGIILLEGNDVSSGLKWALLSNSVVLMPRPTYTSWAMEEMLEPWMHYIPLNDNLTDVEEKVQWMIQHGAEAKRIARRASLWIKDLVFHPQAKIDEALINNEILRRYGAYFHPPNIRSPSALYEVSAVS